MRKSMIHAALKRLIPAVMTALLVFSLASTVSAGAFDVFYDYENSDGTYSYYFPQGVTVTMNKDWYQKTMVIPGDTGATFYHKASYAAYEKLGYTGGRLFTISASVNTDFRNLPSFEYLGFDENECMNYFVILPTDYQAYMDDESIRAEYDELWAGVKDVIAGITLEGASESGSGPETEEPVGEDSLFTRISMEDEFSFEIPSRWGYWIMEDSDMLLASPDGTDTPPLFFVQKEEEGMRAGELIAELKEEFLGMYEDVVVSEPELITYEPAGTDRKLAGFSGVYGIGDRQYTVLEYAEYFGDDLYHYYCCYLSGTGVEGEYEDETTYFEFLNSIDSMVVNN